jgi:hypothetical protein
LVTDDSLDELSDSRPGPDQNAATREIRERIASVVSQLPDKYRIPVVLHFFQEMTHQQIAEALGVPRTTVTSRIETGIQRLEPLAKKAGLAEAVPVLLALVGAHVLNAPATLRAEVVFSRAVESLAVGGSTAISSGGVSYASFANLVNSKAAAMAACALVAAVLVWVAVANREPRTVVSFPKERPVTRVLPRASGPVEVGGGAENPMPATVGTEPESSRSGHPEVPTGASITGRIVSMYDATPLENVNVNLRSSALATGLAESPGLTAKTGPDGLFGLGALPDGSYSIQITPQSPWVARTVDAVVNLGDGVHLGEVALNRLGTIHGRVIRTAENVGIPNEQVTLESNYTTEVLSTVTGENGEFEFTGLTAPLYAIRMKQFSELYRSVTLTQNESVSVEIPIGSASLQGRVFRAGEPYSNARVRVVKWYDHDSALAKAVAVSSDGAYKLDGLSSGIWSVEAFPYQTSIRDQNSTGVIEIVADEIRKQDFNLPSGRLVGVLLDAKGQSVQGVKLIASPTPSGDKRSDSLPIAWETTSSMDGRFAFEGLPPGQYCVAAVVPNLCRAWSPDVTVPHEGNSSELVLRLQDVAGGTLQSVALNLTTGGAMVEAWCELLTDRGRYIHECRRGRDGLMVIDQIPPGEYVVRVSSFGFSVAEHSIQIKSGETVKLEDVLYEAGSLKWTLRNAWGNPVPDATCRLIPNDPSSIESVREGKSGPDGIFVVRGILPGEYTASAVVGEESTVELVRIHAHNLSEKMTTVLTGIASMN